MKTSSLRENRPHLEGVLGPLSADDDKGIRATLAAVDAVLLEIARHMGGSRAGWEGTGLDMAWMESGQTDIRSFVGARTAEGDCVDFCIELRPSWYYGQRSPILTWDIETSIQADCRDPYGNNTMNTVYEATVHAATAPEAASALCMGAHELHRLATGFPLEHWLELTKPPTGRTPRADAMRKSERVGEAEQGIGPGRARLPSDLAVGGAGQVRRSAYLGSNAVMR